jgi:hypothetical protein
MTNCPVCQRDTSPVKIGGQLYCSVCGKAVGPDADKPTSARRLSLDLSPRSRTNVISAVPLAKLNFPAHTRASGAEALHARAKPSRFLDLRQASSSSQKPQLTPEPAHDIPAAPPQSTTRARHQAHFSDRFEKARQVSRSTSINKFASDGKSAVVTSTPIIAVIPSPSVEAVRELPQLAATHHEAMTRLVPDSPKLAAHHSTPKVTPAWRPHLKLSPSGNRNLATAAAVGLMGGYVWLQNYPKLALQNANNQAGLSASMPSFLPSSYSLKTTDTGPGLVTLNFTSPSSSEALKIAQARTTWDTSSLLENFVSKSTDDYATVQGQGLTLYLFNNNHITWVNHGIWYSIEGASRLSREQILKIAYSL